MEIPYLEIRSLYLNSAQDVIFEKYSWSEG